MSAIRPGRGGRHPNTPSHKFVTCQHRLTLPLMASLKLVTSKLSNIRGFNKMKTWLPPGAFGSAFAFCVARAFSKKNSERDETMKKRMIVFALCLAVASPLFAQKKDEE